MTLETIAPETAVELYLSERENELRESTIAAQRSRLKHFRKWCRLEGIEDCNELTGRRIHEFRLWRREDGDLATASERTQLTTLRVFLRWLASIDGVDPDLPHQVRVPTLQEGEHSRGAIIDGETAEDVLAYLGTYEYASRDHVVLAVLWETMLRAGGLRALDLGDYDADERYLSLVHRPDGGTQLKNGRSGQRLVAITPELCAILDDYIADRRQEVPDDHGRRPLVTTTHGRITTSTIRTICYSWSRPCAYGEACPHARRPRTCEAARSGNHASKCPSSEGSHAVRRGSITHYLSEDVPTEAVSRRANVSADVLETHYDERSARQRMEQRRRHFE